jgi:transglutaminase-like putative cysteine protease
MIYHLRHCTTFSYANPVTFVYNILHLKPRALPWQRILRSVLTVTPAPVILSERTDYFGNTASYCTVQHKHNVMKVLIDSIIDVQPRMVPATPGTPWEQVNAVLQADGSQAGLDAFQYCFNSPGLSRSEEARAYALPSCKPGWSVHEVATDLMHRIHAEFTFDAGATDVSTPVLEVLKTRKGVCQDFANLMISCLRSVGLPARYNSGYIRTAPPPGKKRLQGADASHAWAGVYCPRNGWLDLDPTNDKPANDEFITIGWGRDYHDISPARGVLLGGGKHTVHVEVDMIPETELQQGQQQQQ